MMTMTKRTAELVKGDVVVDEQGRERMTIRRIAQAVDRDYTVVWFFGPRGGKQLKGFLTTTEWMVKASA